jgi:hypothetical protein
MKGVRAMTRRNPEFYEQPKRVCRDCPKEIRPDAERCFRCNTLYQGKQRRARSLAKRIEKARL